LQSVVFKEIVFIVFLEGRSVLGIIENFGKAFLKGRTEFDIVEIRVGKLVLSNYPLAGGC
jgi:hypothetical protein